MPLSYAVRGAATAQRIRHQMKRTGKSPWGHWLWTKEEDRKVIFLYPDYKKLKKVLRRRTLRSIRHRASDIGIAKKRHIWTGAEITKLRKLYPTASREEILANFPGLDWQKISSRARYAGFRRKRKSYKGTGYGVLDAVRERAFALRLSMADLDDMASTKKYFQKGGWIGKNIPNKKAILRAIEALGGEIQVKWE